MKKTTFRNSIIFSIMIFAITCFMSIGFSVVQQNLEISGTITPLLNTMLVNNSNSSYFLDCSNIPNSGVKKVYFKKDAPTSYNYVCDVSAKQNGSVQAYYRTSDGVVAVVPTDSNNKIYFNTKTKLWNLTKCTLINFGTNVIDTKNLRNMQKMFIHLCNSSQCESAGGMAKLDLSKFDTSNVTDMTQAFDDAKYVKSFDLSSFNTSKVYYYQIMFRGCESIETLNLSSFNTSVACAADGMFQNASNLKRIYVTSSFNMTNISNVTCPGTPSVTGNGDDDVFSGSALMTYHPYTQCSNAQGSVGSYIKIDGGSSSPGCLDDVNNMP